MPPDYPLGKQQSESVCFLTMSLENHPCPVFPGTIPHKGNSLFNMGLNTQNNRLKQTMGLDGVENTHIPKGLCPCWGGKLGG